MLTLLLAPALVFAATHGAPSVLVRAIDTESAKAVAVVADPRFDEHQPAPVSERALARAMMNAGLFTEEDVRYLAGPIAAELGSMEPAQQVRIIYWAGDGSRRIYLLVHGGSLRVAYFRGDVPLERSETRLPKSEEPAAVATPAAQATSTIANAAPSPSAGAQATPARRKTEIASLAPLTRLSEAEARQALIELDAHRGALVGAEYTRKRKEILNRL